MAENMIAVPEEIVDFKPGTRIWFGNEKTQWRVLEVNREEDTALLIADAPICERQFHKDKWSVRWDECDLRKWLNEVYYEKSFTDFEKDAISESSIKNQGDPHFGTKSSKPTTDRLFLLSVKEAKKYFGNNKDRATKCGWWLRTPGYSSFYAANVYDDGEINYHGNNVNGRKGVRPAFRIKLNSELFQSLISDSKSENLKIKEIQYHVWEGIFVAGNVSNNNAESVIQKITEQISGMKKIPIKTAEAAVEFAVKNASLLTKDSVNKLCDVLREKKLGELADNLLADPQ